MTGTTAVTTSIVVEAPADQAFTVFTEDIGSWWPAEHHILAAPLATMVFEPRVGGHVYDVGTDGSECRLRARVLAYEPPTRVVFSWDISLQWQIETDPARTSEVEVRFVPESQHRTRVELEPAHRPPRRRVGGHARRCRLTRGVGCRAAAVLPAPGAIAGRGGVSPYP